MTRTVKVELETPNFDVAVERAVKRAADLDSDDNAKQTRRGGGEGYRHSVKIVFVGLEVEVRAWYGRENLFTYEFRAETA